MVPHFKAPKFKISPFFDFIWSLYSSKFPPNRNNVHTNDVCYSVMLVNIIIICDANDIMNRLRWYSVKVAQFHQKLFFNNIMLLEKYVQL